MSCRAGAGRLRGRVPGRPRAAGTGGLAETGRLCRRRPRRGDLPGPQRPAPRRLQRPRRPAVVAGQAAAAGAAAGRRRLSRAPRAATSRARPISAAGPPRSPGTTSPVFRYWELEPPPAGVGVVMPYSTADRPCWNAPVGNGRVLTMTTPVSDRAQLDRHPWNLLPVGRRRLALRDPDERHDLLPGRRRGRATQLCRRPARRLAPG